ncbi:hypothetical protein [Aliicoccus persicus]|uniref:Uncharacterized protein n=1 Tax=Aliicoccus persicus TaxID=930138 RepID=A0A662Z2S2_9STAP|nr:hypothetical protein [Aliicoccus persicus]SEV97086.1 hypothetical protein SAMN05192557_1070 [Aliicoccus persicus]
MVELIKSIEISEWIQITSILAATTISVVSIIIATKSLRLTRKSIEDANKPYISCYVEIIEVAHFQKYFVIKNFGKTPATIIDIIFDKEITGLGRQGKVDSIKNALLVPNQKFITSVDVTEKENFTVKIIYKDMNNRIDEKLFNLNLDFTSDLRYNESSNKELTKDTNALRNALHQFTKRGI